MKTFDLHPLSKIIVYVDMDGVLVDTYTHIAKLIGVHHYEQITPDQWEEFYNKVDGYDLFKDLPIFPTADRLLSIVNKYAGKYSILSTPLSYDVAGSIDGKNEWIATYKLQPADVIYEATKARYATNNGLPNVLIDDSMSNITKWQAAGGIAIKYQADKDTFRVVVDGLNRAVVSLKQLDIQ